MTKIEIRKERQRLLKEIDTLEQRCEGCQTHYELNKVKDITALTNACKMCPIGQQMSQYGDILLKLTDTRKKAPLKAE